MRAIDADKIAYYDDEQGFEMAYKVDIDALPTLTPPNEWVSVDEKFPEINQKVIAFLEGMYSMAEFYGTYYDGTPIWSYTGMGGDPTHWTLLPAPPVRRPPEGEANE